MNLPDRSELLTSEATRRQAWEDAETSVAAALHRLRAVVEDTRGPAVAGDVATDPATDLGVVDVVRGSAGMWQAWWLYADVLASPEVSAILPDLRPLEDIAAGQATGEWADLHSVLGRNDAVIRVILPDAARTDPVARELIGEVVDAGLGVRTGETADWFCVSRDRSVAAPVPWGAIDEAEVVVLRGSPIVGAFAELFEHRWALARPWSSSDDRDVVLDLLAEGCSDDEVADRLGISVRTVRRRVAEAMRAHGASTRFELGVRHAVAARPSC